MADLPLVAIKEANTHLQALHERNIKLEQEVHQLKALLSLKQEQEERLLGQKQLLQDKDDKVAYLEKELVHVSKQLQDNAKKDLIITQLTRKVKLLNEILKYKSALESITVCLEQVEEDFIVDIDNLINVTNNVSVNMNDGNNNGDLDLQMKLNDTNTETTL